jgi:hypothetical protein
MVTDIAHNATYPEWLKLGVRRADDAAYPADIP